jgi:hypothetical protein
MHCSIHARNMYYPPVCEWWQVDTCSSRAGAPPVSSHVLLGRGRQPRCRDFAVCPEHTLPVCFVAGLSPAVRLCPLCCSSVYHPAPALYTESRAPALGHAHLRIPIHTVTAPPPPCPAVRTRLHAGCADSAGFQPTLQGAAGSPHTIW